MTDPMEAIANSAGGNKTVSSDLLEEVTALAKLQCDLEDTVDQLEAKLKETKAELRTVAEEKLPEALQTVGLSSVTLDNGAKISTSKFYNAHISEVNREAAHEWLRRDGQGDIIKNEVKAQFGKGKEAEAAAAMQALNDLGVMYSNKESVHASTLKSFIKNALEGGKDIPFETFGVYVGNKSKISRS